MKRRIIVMALALMIGLAGLNVSYGITYTSAEYLYRLGLLSNISEQDLNATLNRLVGLTMILKTLGYTDEDARLASAKKNFNDMTGNYEWGAGWTNIGVDIHITTGTTQFLFSPDEMLSKKEFLSYQLRALGYGVLESWDNCTQLALDTGLISKSGEINDMRFTKADAANVVYRALSAKVKDRGDMTLLEQLIDDGVINKKVAESMLLPALNKLYVEKIDTILNSKFLVTLQQPVKVVNKNEIVITDRYGQSVTVESATLSNDGLKVVVVTKPQKAYILHTMKIGEYVHEYYALAIDALSPQLASIHWLSQTTFRLSFTESLDESALNKSNYNINGLTVLKVEFEKNEKNEDILSKVIVTTSIQNPSASYSVTVSGVKDLSGNILSNVNSSIALYVPAADYIKPRLNMAYAINSKTIKLVFSEYIDEATAENISNYYIDGLTILKADRQSSYNVVNLTTTAQTPGYIYRVIIDGVKDLGGNTLEPSSNTATLVGLGIDQTLPYLISASSLSNTKIRVIFSEPITDSTGAMSYAYYLGESLGYPIMVEKDSSVTNGTVWVLTTLPQDSINYTMDVTGLMDMEGNMLDETRDTFLFTGIK